MRHGKHPAPGKNKTQVQGGSSPIIVNDDGLGQQKSKRKDDHSPNHDSPSELGLYYPAFTACNMNGRNEKQQSYGMYVDQVGVIFIARYTKYSIDLSWIIQCKKTESKENAEQGSHLQPVNTPNVFKLLEGLF